MGERIALHAPGVYPKREEIVRFRERKARAEGRI